MQIGDNRTFRQLKINTSPLPVYFGLVGEPPPQKQNSVSAIFTPAYEFVLMHYMVGNPLVCLLCFKYITLQIHQIGHVYDLKIPHDQRCPRVSI